MLAAAGSTRRDRALAIALFAVAAGTSVTLDAGVVCSNDGAHYALVRALADYHTTSIDKVIAYTNHVDYSVRDGRAYSDRPPGTAMAALPFYLVARALSASDATRQAVTALFSALVGALAVVLTFATARRLGFGRPGAAAAALVLATCTPHRTYSTALWSHAFSAFLVVLCVWLATPRAPGEPAPRSWATRLLFGVAAGYAIGVDYSVAVVSLLLLGVVCGAAYRSGGRWSLLAAAVPLAAGALVGLAPTLIYHQAAFGSPLATPYRFHVHFPTTRSVSSTYSGSFLEGLFGLLVSWRAGLLLYSPILVVALAAAPRMARALGWQRALCVVAPWVLMLLVTAKHSTWHGGGAHDARYLMCVMPLFCLPLAEVVDRLVAGGRPDRLLAFAGLFGLSALVQVVKHSLGWSREIAPWLSMLGRAADGDRLGEVAQAMLAWMFPHPLVGAAIMGLGIAAAAGVAWPARDLKFFRSPIQERTTH
jgi:hypothetical protein